MSTGHFSVIRDVTFQQLTPSTVWTFPYQSNKPPIVDVYCDINGTIEKIIPLSVVMSAPGECQITFSTARAGTVVISG